MGRNKVINLKSVRMYAAISMCILSIISIFSCDFLFEPSSGPRTGLNLRFVVHGLKAASNADTVASKLLLPTANSLIVTISPLSAGLTAEQSRPASISTGSGAQLASVRFDDLVIGRYHVTAEARNGAVPLFRQSADILVDGGKVTLNLVPVSPNLVASASTLSGATVNPTSATTWRLNKDATTLESGNVKFTNLPVDGSVYIFAQELDGTLIASREAIAISQAAFTSLPRDRDIFLTVYNSGALSASFSLDPAYSIRYEGNSPGVGTPPVDENVYIAGESLTLKASANLQGSAIVPGIHQRFLGWFDAPVGGTQYPGPSIVMTSGGRTLYAQYSVDASIIGKCGPAGGWVFYDKGSYSNGWRYLEAAPTDTSVRVRWSDITTIVGTSLSVGEGKRNTQLAMDAGCTDGAIYVCSNYTLNGFDDWFLPSHDEINAFYANLVLNTTYGALCGINRVEYFYYYSSSEDSTHAYRYCFFLGGSWNTPSGDKASTNPDYVGATRAIRQF